MGIFSNFLKENKKEQKPLITIDKELSKLAVDLVGGFRRHSINSFKI